MDTYNQDGFVIQAGQVMAVDSSGYLVPANGGVATYVLYTSHDVGKTLNINTGTLVTDSDLDVDATKSMYLAPNVPVGFAPMHYYQNLTDPTARYTNYNRQDLVPMVMDWLLELPYVRSGSWTAPYDMDANGVLFDGCLLQPLPRSSSLASPVRASTLGKLCLYRVSYAVANGVPTDYGVYGGVGLTFGLSDVGIESQLVAQLLMTVSGFPKDALNMVGTLPGLGLDGSGTAGLPAHLNVAGNGMTSAATSSTTSVSNVRALRVNILK